MWDYIFVAGEIDIPWSGSETVPLAASSWDILVSKHTAGERVSRLTSNSIIDCYRSISCATVVSTEIRDSIPEDSKGPWSGEHNASPLWAISSLQKVGMNHWSGLCKLLK